MKMNSRRRLYLKNPVASIFVLLCFCGAFVLMISVLRLPQSPVGPLRPKEERKRLHSDEKIGNVGKMVVEMLPEDLGFTVFLPSEKAFERDLGLHWNGSFLGENMNNSYAVLTRVLGFSVVPRMIHLSDLPSSGEEVNYDSLEGYSLYVSRDEDGMLMVNRIRSEQVNLMVVKKILVHVMDGVVMDAEFEDSVLPD